MHMQVNLKHNCKQKQKMIKCKHGNINACINHECIKQCLHVHVCTGVKEIQLHCYIQMQRQFKKTKVNQKNLN